MKRLLLILALVSVPLATAQAGNQFKGYINEVLYNPVGPDSSNQKVEIWNGGTSNIVLTNWSICIQFNYKRFPSGATIPPGGTYIVHLNKAGTSNAREFFTGPYVNVNPAADAVALYHTFSGFGTPANMEDFVQWGAAGQPRENVAAAAGALLWTAGTFIPTGPEGQSFAYNNRTVTPPAILPHPVSDYCYDVPSLGMMNTCSVPVPIVLNEILADPTGPNAGNTVVEIQNTGTTAVNLGGWNWSTQLVNGSFGVNQTIGAGRFLLIRLNAAGTNNDTTLFAGIGTPDLNPAAGSFTLYKNSTDFTNPATMVDFVQWGAGGQAREDVAAAGGHWPLGTFAGAVSEGHSIGYTGAGNDPAAWCDQEPPTLRAPTGCLPVGCSCLAVRINEVLTDPIGDETGATRVELINTGATPADLVAMTIVVGANHYTVPSSLTIPAGGIIVVRLNESGTNDGNNIFTGSALPDLDPTGDSFSLFFDDQNFSDPTRMIDFIEWGSGGQSGEGVAVAAGIWTAGAFFPGTDEGGSVQWRGTGTGNVVEDFCADQPTLWSSNVCTTSGVPDGGMPGAPLRFLRNYPNPFSPSTSITFDLRGAQNRVTLTVFSVSGSAVRNLLDAPAAAGVTTIEWDGKDDHGRALPNGIYFYRLDAGPHSITRKLAIFR